MCINNILLSKLKTSFTLFLSVSVYFDIFITAHMHFCCHDVTAGEFGWYKRRFFRFDLQALLAVTHFAKWIDLNLSFFIPLKLPGSRSEHSPLLAPPPWRCSYKFSLAFCEFKMAPAKYGAHACAPGQMILKVFGHGQCDLNTFIEFICHWKSYIFT